MPATQSHGCFFLLRSAPGAVDLPFPRRNQMHHDTWSHPCYAKGFHLATQMHKDLRTQTDREGFFGGVGLGREVLAVCRPQCKQKGKQVVASQ